MLQPSCLQLNIWCNGQCTFQLIWGERQQMSTKVPFPTAVMERYQAWKRLYLHVYPSLTRGRIGREGVLTSGMDWKHLLQEAELSLLEAMHQWLGGQELLAIREKIVSLSQPLDFNDSSHKGFPVWCNLLIACDHSQIIRLPWEAWKITSQEPTRRLIRISRTPISGNELPIQLIPKHRSRSPRILAILSNASELNLQADRAGIRSLEKVAEIEFIELAIKESGPSFKERLKAKIIDDRGWDILLFSGHSNESSLTGGKIHLAQDISLSISEIEPELICAKERGLRVAIFNSCNGLSLAHSLIQLGLHQVLVMREQIQDRVAQVFLTQVCQQLAAFQDLHQSLLNACDYFQSEQIAYPSISLIPSLFCHPQADIFQFKRSRLKRLWRKWRPTRSESITVGIAIAVSLMVPVQDLLLDSRTFVQAVYRDQTQQVPQPQTPPVQLIAIDQTSINRAINTIEGFEIKPIDRRYLANVVNRLAEQNIKTIGIDYELYTEESHNETLKQAIKAAVGQGTWFVFAVNGQNQKWLLPKIASSNWSLQGDILFWPWFVEQPDDLTCEQPCPFAYLLALTDLLQQESSELKNLNPSLQNRTLFQTQLTQSLQQQRMKPLTQRLEQSFSPLPWPSAMIDFSIPPEQVYQKIPAWEFLNSDGTSLDIQVPTPPHIALIASGEYEEAEDNFSVPLAINYWCHAQRHSPSNKDCPSVFTGGEAHAYMVQHMIKGKRKILVPDFWMIVLAAILGKLTMQILLKQERGQRQRRLMGYSFVPIGYGILGLQMYISVSLAIPWFWPSIIFWKYLLILKKNYGE